MKRWSSSVNAFKRRISFILVEFLTSISVQQFTSSILIIIRISILGPVEKELLNEQDIWSPVVISRHAQYWYIFKVRMGENMWSNYGTHTISSLCLPLSEWSCDYFNQLLPVFFGPALSLPPTNLGNRRFNLLSTFHP
jgi:hypothetical protein